MQHKHVRAMLIGIAFAYVALGGLLFFAHPDPQTLAIDLAIPLVISLAGIATAFVTYREPAAQTELGGAYTPFTCAGRTTPLQAISLAAAGFFLGALLYHLTKLVA